ERRVDEAAAAPRRPQARVDGGAQQGACGDLLARRPVQRGELAVGAETREARREVLDEGPFALGSVHRRGGVRCQRPADDQPDVAAHRVEGEVVLVAHDVLVASGAAADAPELLSEVLLDGPRETAPITRSSTVVR